MTVLYSNIKNVKERIANAATRSGRKLEDITLIAVTKTMDVEIINQAIQFGVRDIGENRVQEIQKKYDYVNNKEEMKWHLIGHLQTNKVKYIIDKVHLIHSVDSFKLASEINNQAAKHNKVMDILIQINVSGEESKFGLSSDEYYPKLLDIAKLPNVKVRGLMTIAPYATDSEEVRPIFRELNDLFIDIKDKNIDNISMDYLSMGMSGDFEVAIEEGANIVRVGTAIFGKRNYVK